MLVQTFRPRVRDVSQPFVLTRYWSQPYALEYEILIQAFCTRIRDESLMPPPMTMDRAYDIMEVHHKMWYVMYVSIASCLVWYVMYVSITTCLVWYVMYHTRHHRQLQKAIRNGEKELQHYKERNEAKANDLKRALTSDYGFGPDLSGYVGQASSEICAEYNEEEMKCS
ncbi:hypothetical protein CEXT_94561 [Caerostris extrusa]|uniref:Uncharacterized protein n=1 Tax=Caerostris extrusa TaxID=172846 RepID=A0AAV4XZV2_CAEEX|nr:hypothetical protein CEXT_94561 [Caerostris extrusa]